MRLLLQAIFRTKQHFMLLLGTFATLILLTVASQMEMFSLGILANNGSDFFSLFSSEQVGSSEGISLSEVQSQWPQVAEKDSSLITKQSAAMYLSSKKETNPLNWLLLKFQNSSFFGSDITAIITLLLCVAIFKAIWLFASRYSTQLLAIRISRDLRQQYFEHIQSLPMSFYQKYNIGSLSSRVVGDAGQIAISINACLTNYLQTPILVGSCLSICFYISWKLSSIIFIGMPLIVFPIRVLAGRVKRVSRQLQSNQEKFTTVLLDFLAGIQTVKVFSMEAFSLKKYKEQNDKMAHLESKTAKYSLLARPILHGITTLCLAVIVLFGLYVIGMTLSQLIVFCGLLQLVYEPVKKFAEENANVQKGVVAAERMFEVLNLKLQIEDQEGALDLTEFKDCIEFDRVWFRYLGEWILQDVSFKIKKGETVAFVGPTGSGKSTLAQLLPRLYEVEKGEIRIDGKPIQSYTQKSIRELIGFVSQKPFLFIDTIQENITVGRKISKEIVEIASRRAYAEEFICRLPAKYETVLYEAGQNLSGGQQQRLAIARALARNTPILVLDEATSSLDALSEQHIKNAIAALQGEVTQIIIAHRLSTIDHADKILYIERGIKIAEGSKEELLSTCPPFKAMWEMMYNIEKTTPSESKALAESLEQ
jgi:ABC-type multidrug transport system fused ATPase/permease subunit